MMRWIGLMMCTAVASVGLSVAGVPSAALFAGLVVAAILAVVGWAPRARGDKPPMPRPIGLAAQGVLGVYIGTLISTDTLSGIGSDWPAVLSMALATLVLSVVGGALLGLHRNVDSLTGSLALVAGGASGLVALARELGGDERIVAVVQYLRVAIITMSMPLVAIFVYGKSVSGGGGEFSENHGNPWWGLLVLAVCMVVGYGVGRVIRLPAAGLLGPLILSVAGELLGITTAAAIPVVLVQIAYAVIGWQAGLGFTKSALVAIARILPFATVLIVAIAAASAGLGALLSLWTGESMFDSYLATTPGGIYAVLATASATGGNLAFIVAAQMLRVLIMLFVAPFAARAYQWLLRRRHSAAASEVVSV
ncbi:AbrB family transcriptional regulator [Williamsia sp. R60]